MIIFTGMKALLIYYLVFTTIKSPEEATNSPLGLPKQIHWLPIAIFAIKKKRRYSA